MRGNKDIKDQGKKFSSEYQPTPEAKSEGRQRIRRIREMVAVLSDQMASVETIGGHEVELSYEAELIYSLFKRARDGDNKAAEILLSQIRSGHNLNEYGADTFVIGNRRIQL